MGTCVAGECARLVFVTSGVYTIGAANNQFDSLVAADKICQDLATGEGLKNEFKAWLSDSQSYPAGARFATKSTRPYMTRDTTPVATSFADLVDGTIAAPIEISEQGIKLSAGKVWTATNRTARPRCPTRARTGRITCPAPLAEATTA